MLAKDWIDLVSALAWPVVAFAGLIYIWRSDAIGKLIKISDAVKDLNGRLSELVEAELKLTQTSGPIIEATAMINQVQADFLSIKADVENIRDKVEQRGDVQAPAEQEAPPLPIQTEQMFEDMEEAWQELMQAMDERFGWFDRRSVAGEAYRFAHGNRKGPRLSYEQADEIARLHSSMKSYRRRYAKIDDWLDQEVRDDFINSCRLAIEMIRNLNSVHSQ